MMKKILFLCISVLFLAFSPVSAQKSLPEVEQELADMANDILMHDSLSFKIKQNKVFAKLLIETLKRPESFDYPFDLLKTISIQEPKDQTFRLFTWHIVDKNFKEYYGEQYHYYFGLVQRKYEEKGQTEFIVIPLLEMQQIPQGVENMLLDNRNWLGALYYQPKYHDYLPSYTSKFYDRKLSASGSQKKVKKTFYVLLGWNGNDQKSNYKIVDIMSFDPEDKNRVIFGSDVFYFDQLPKYRALFKYSEYSPFSLNYSFAQVGSRKAKMIIYDHMGSPKRGDQKLEEIWDTGADGSYDGLYFYKKGGYFEWYRNVELAEKFISKENRKAQEEVRKNQQKIMEEREKILGEDESVQEQFVIMEKGSKKEFGRNQASKKEQKKMLKELEEKSRKEQEKLKDLGIKTKKNN
ncbi:MAG: hypothetical protein KDE26_30160 [Bacteroidetes bacterium]|nr:hypothetical protein [Bacteroidota bacterium]